MDNEILKFDLSQIKDKIFVIAEIGINHNGSIDNALKLIDIAKNCGADAVKFQKRSPNISVPEDQKNKIRNTPWGEMTYLEYKIKIEFEKEEYDIIDKYCKSKQIYWTASAWDLPSLEFIENYDVPFHKIASALLTHKELLLAIKKTGRPTILSTGMSSEKEINDAVKIFGSNYPLVILHCNSEYPSRPEKLNLNYIPVLMKNYPKNLIGYSSHDNGISVPIVAATLGARVIEKHITLDRSMWGTDQSASIEQNGLRRMIRDLKNLDIWLGKPIKEVTDIEKLIKLKLRNVNTL